MRWTLGNTKTDKPLYNILIASRYVVNSGCKNVSNMVGGDKGIVFVKQVESSS